MANQHPQPERAPLSRAASAIVYHDPQTLDELLPPKRDLPFQKPAPPRSKKRAVEDTSGPLSGDAGPTQPRRTAQSRRQRPATSSAALPLSSSSKGQAAQECAQSQPKKRGPSKSSKARPASSTNAPLEPVPTIENNSKKKDQRVVDQGVSTIQPTSDQASHPGSSPDQNVPNQMTATETIHPLTPSTRNPTATGPGPGPSLTRAAGLIMESITTATATATVMTTADLTEYLSAPDSQRASLVETWVCQQLEDDGFLQLCRDVEGVWQRIALGVKSG